MKINHKTFCVAPWFQIRNNADDSYAPCCELRAKNTEFSGNANFKYPEDLPLDFLNSEYAKYLRENLSNGNRLPECDNCWKKEKYGQKSLRQTLNKTVTNNREFDQSWLKLYFSNKNNYEFDFLYSADVKLSFVCNFECAMCYPDDSSKLFSSWQSSQDQFFVKDIIAKEPAYFENIKNRYSEKRSYDLLNELLDKHPKFLKILGGEPLLDQKMLKILTELCVDRAKNITLLIVTNGSVDLVSIANRLAHFKQVMFIISLEGTDQVQDYIRKGSNWLFIKENIENFCKRYKQSLVSINYTVQALTLYHLPDLLTWANSIGIRVNSGIIEEPDYLSLSSIPGNLKATILDKLISRNDLSIDHTNDSVSVEGLCELLQDVEHNPEHTKQLKSYLQWYDPDQNWKHIFPEWLPYLC